MNRRELLANSLAAASVLALPIVTYASPQRLFHYEIPMSHFNIHDKVEMLESFDRGVSIGQKVGYSHREEEARTQHVLAFVKDANIPVEVFYTIEPSAYFDNYRKVVFNLRTINPADQATVNEAFAFAPVVAVEKENLFGDRKPRTVYAKL